MMQRLGAPTKWSAGMTALLAASGLYLNQPTLGMDLNDVRARVQGVGWVKDAKVVRMLPDTVLIAVEERPALAVWQNQGRMKVIDGEGRVSADLTVSGADALTATQAEVFDLILMDMRMPGLSGEETARQLRSNGVKTPIVALTANAFEDDRHACLAAGMDDFLVKPLSPDALRAALTRWTNRTERAKVAV